MKSRFAILFLLISLLCHNLINGQTKDSTKSNEKIFENKLVPLKAEKPKATKKKHKINSKDFVINLISKQILITYKNKTVSFENYEKFDKYLKEAKISEIKAQIYLEIEMKTNSKKTLEVFKILELNNIKNFNIVTKK